MTRKLEVINNTIGNCYELRVYSWKKPKWWKKIQWVWEFSHTIGKKYMCPRIHQKKITVEQLFEEELNSVMNDYHFNEIHNITVTTHDKFLYKY